MSDVRLRPLERPDLAVLEDNETPEKDPWNFFAARPSNRLERRFAADGCLTDDLGQLAVENEEGTLIGSVSWNTVQHGPTAACRAVNVGITLFEPYRGKGYGTAAQRALADHLFSTRLLERIEASTDIENGSEQRALEKAGFTREGVLRHAQFRAGQWRDVVLFSRLRGDP